MGCGCKNTKNDSIESVKTARSWSESNKTTSVIKYGFKIFGFLIALLTLPFIVLAIIWFMFDLIVLNREVDIAKLTKVLATKIKFANDTNNSEDEDYEDEIEEAPKRVVSIEDLEHMIEDAIKNEEYEIAAEIRDRIEKLKKEGN